MPDLWNKMLEKLHVPSVLKTALDHWRYTSLSVVLATVLGGCQLFEPVVPSVVDPKVKVSRSELEAEVAAFNTTVESQRALFLARFQLLDEADRKRSLIVSSLVQVLGAAGPGLAPVVAVLATLVGGGAVADNLRKDAVLAKTTGR